MEPNESRSLDFKQRIKQSFAPHLLNPCNREEQNEASNPLNPSKYEQSENIEQNVVEASEDIEKIVAADAEELAKSFKKFKNKKNKKYSNCAESSRKASNWNMSIKKVLHSVSCPESTLETPEEVLVAESTLKTPEELVDRKPYLLCSELLESAEPNPWTFHRLSKDDCQTPGNLEDVSRQSSYGNCNKTHYTKEEKEVLKVLRSARTFKPLKKSNLNDFDGAGVNCFKDKEIKSCINNKKVKNVPPPGGYVCIKPLTIEDVMKRPPNLIIDECWDYDDEEW